MQGGDGNSGAKNGQWVSIPQIVRNIWKDQFNWNMVSENLYQTINSRHNLMVLFAAPLVIVRCERLVAAAGWYPVCGRCYDCSRVHPKCNNLIEKCKHVTSMFFMVYDCALWECGWGHEWIPRVGNCTNRRVMKEFCLVVSRGDYEVTPGTSQAHSQNNTCCVPWSTIVLVIGAPVRHHPSQEDTIGQPNHVG